MLAIGRRADFPPPRPQAIILMAVVALAWLACARWLKIERA
jgi:spermidine/putrescine transport system permease protein